MTKKILKAAKELDFTSDQQLYEYIIDSWYNGNFNQCEKLFNGLPRDNKHELIRHIRDVYAKDELHNYFVSLF